MHAHQVAIENTVLDHRVALHAQQVVRHTGKGTAIQMQGGVYVQIRPDGCACRHAPQHGYFQQFGTRFGVQQANAACLVRHDFDQAGFGQGHNVLARHAARSKAEGLGDFRQARRLPLLRDAIADEGKDCAATGR